MTVRGVWDMQGRGRGVDVSVGEECGGGKEFWKDCVRWKDVCRGGGGGGGGGEIGETGGIR